MVDEYWYGEVHRISPEAPVPCVKITRQEDRFGAADNVAANIRALGGDVVTATCNVARKIRLVARNQQVARVDFDWEPKADDLGRQWLLFRLALKNCSIVVLSDYNKGSLVDAQRYIQAAINAGCTILVDPKGHDYKRYEGADLVKPNTDELKAVVGGWSTEAELEDKAMALMESCSIPRLLLTRAAEGMTLFSLHEHKYSIPAEVLEVYDVTGAGDTAIATLAVYLNRSFSWEESVRMANKAAGIVCRKFGTATVTLEELENGTL